ncbi:MAG: hypothetical protein KBT53_01665 [Porticoccus sp.]|nr:hypothetical protein [Porticoccus sp.]MBQ0807980.1 hypothetical protein [Porticoccus sp.]
MNDLLLILSVPSICIFALAFLAALGWVSFQKRIVIASADLVVTIGLASAAWWYLFDQWLGIGSVLWLTIAFFILYILDAVVRG